MSVPKNLIICGSGIKSLSHHTREFDVAVKNADVVIYLINEPILELWLQENSKKSFSLRELYFLSPQRANSYRLIEEKVIASFKHYNNICLVFYGHPLLLADSVSSIIKEAKSKDIKVQVLPGLSAFDCLLADLEIKLDGGCFMMEATFFLKHQTKIDTSYHVILWQIGMIDISSSPTSENPGSLLKLKNELIKYYPTSSIIYLYEASLYPYRKPLIVRTNINDLTEYHPSSITTAYIPPIRPV
jgi:uncharacterized protein YabN with tetrapyrrole methylase and pyrophosphatase domain